MSQQSQKFGQQVTKPQIKKKRPLFFYLYIEPEMRLGSLSAELDAITREFDYGIVPGSATVFVKDEVNCIGRLDLTLLEGVMIVIEVTDQGYKVK